VLRVKLLKLAEEEHILQRTFHNIVSDAGRWACFMRELRDLYDAYSQGAHHLPDLPFNSRILPCQTQEAVTGGRMRTLRSGKTACGKPEELEIPKDRPRPSLQTYAGDACGITVALETVAAFERCGHSTLLYDFAHGIRCSDESLQRTG